MQRITTVQFYINRVYSLFSRLQDMQEWIDMSSNLNNHLSSYLVQGYCAPILGRVHKHI